MKKLIASLQKEFLILFRDKGGMAIVFVMPIFLVVIMALIQDAPFRDFSETKIPMALANEDRDTIGSIIERGLQSAPVFVIQKEKDGVPLTGEMVKQFVAKGDYKIGIIIPSGLTDFVEYKVNRFAASTFSSVGLGEEPLEDQAAPDSVEVYVSFDPVTKKAFKTTVTNALEKLIADVQTQFILSSFHELMRDLFPDTKANFPTLTNTSIIGLKKEYASEKKVDWNTNSTQHNVPAWTIFAMFLIVIPLTGNIIREREGGSYTRLMTIPMSRLVYMGAKMILYLIVCLAQFLLMLAVGIYLLPLLGLPELVIASDVFSIGIVVLATSLAATCFGVMMGAIFNTQQQAAIFSLVTVFVLAAIGGIWVPVYVMPDSMQLFSQFSPLNWGHTAFNQLFLRGGDYSTVFPQIALLFIFSAITFGLSLLKSKKTA